MTNKLLFFLDDNGVQTELDDTINLEVGKLKPGNYAKLRTRRKHFECKVLFESQVHDLPAPTFMTKPFSEIPDTLKSDYTYDGRIVINSYYIDYNFPTNRTSRMTILML